MPNDGDILAIKEIRRVLKDEGAAFVSVPYAQEFHEGESHGRHFERMYDYKMLQERLVKPSGLSLEHEGFIFDKASKRLAGMIYYKLPGYTRYFLGWTGLLLLVSRILSHWDKASKRDAQFYWMLLKKTS